MKLATVLLFSLISSVATAGTIRLFNDSPYKLRAVIRANDASYVGELTILPGYASSWSSESSFFGPGGHAHMDAPNYTMTPFSVHWYCPDGGDFGVSDNIATGGAAVALGSTGVHYCKPPAEKKKESPYTGGEHDYGQQEQEQAQPPGQSLPPEIPPTPPTEEDYLESEKKF